MSGQGWTPRPWQVDGPASGNPKFGLWDVEGALSHVASNCTLADARLIAAAPDLAEAAIEIDRLFLVIESAVRNADPRHQPVVLAALKANRAALAKAGGSDA